MKVGNLFANIPTELSQELIQEISCGKSCRIERIVSKGQCSEKGFWYDQEEDELIFLLSGQASLQLEHHTSLVELKAGDYLHIPAHCRHRVDWTLPDQESVWLAIFFHK